MSTLRVISADSHFIEPPEMWAERMDKRFRNRAPRVIADPSGTVGGLFVCENINPSPVSNLWGAGHDKSNIREVFAHGFEAAPESVWNPAKRLEDQDRDGVCAEVIYTSFGMPLFSLHDVELRAACFEAFNSWAADYCSYAPERLIGLGLVSLDSPESGVDELKRLAAKELRGAAIWSAAPDHRPYHHPDYDNFWAAAQDLDLPLSLHVSTSWKGNTVDFATGNAALPFATMHQEAEQSIAQLVLGGVLQRFPKLKIVSAENDAGWMAYFMWRLDNSQHLLGGMSNERLESMPSEYIKRQVFATVIDEPVFLKTLDIYGPDNIMWSSDYPHHASSWPNSQKFIKDTLGQLPAADVQKLVFDTASRVYGIS